MLEAAQPTPCTPRRGGREGAAGRRKTAVQSTVLMCLALVLAACSGSSSSDNSSPSNGPAKIGGSLVFDLPTAPLDLDPSTSQDNNGSMQMWNAWFEYLVQSDPDTGQFSPMLATQWNVSKDQKTYTFKLRANVKFSDGSPLTGADVVYALNRDMAPKISLLHSLSDKISRISTAGNTVTIQMEQPWPHLLADLASPTAAIYPRQALQNAGDKAFFTQNPVGTGPFMLTSVVPNSSYKVQRNTNYWGSRPKLDEITFQVVNDDSARATAVLGGRADIAINPPANQLNALKGNSSVRVLSFPSALVELIVLNTKKPPFDNTKVRQAFSLALDRQAIIQSGLFGYADQATSFLVPPPKATFQNPSLNLYPFDVAKGRALMKESGISTPITVPLEVSTGADQDAILNIAESNLKEIGINVQPVRKDSASVDNDIIGQNYSAATTFWGDISADPSIQPLFAIDPAYCCDAYFSGYNDPALISLTHKAVDATDRQQAQLLFNRVQVEMAKAAYLVPLYYPKLNYLTSSKVTGFAADPFAMYNWRTVGLTQ